jgi:hypothetical protein
MAVELITIPEHTVIRRKDELDAIEKSSALLEVAFHRLVRKCINAGLDWGDVEAWIEETWREETE